MKKKELFSKEWMKEFNRLSDKDKVEVLKTVLSQKINDALSRQLPNQVIFGMEVKANDYYNRYVSELDGMVQGSADWNAIVERLLSEIREGRLAYVQHYENMMRGDTDDNMS